MRDRERVGKVYVGDSDEKKTWDERGEDGKEVALEKKQGGWGGSSLKGHVE